MPKVLDLSKPCIEVSLSFDESKCCGRFLSEVQDLLRRSMPGCFGKVYVEAIGTNGRTVPVDTSNPQWLVEVLLLNAPPEAKLSWEANATMPAVGWSCHDEGRNWGLSVSVHPDVFGRGGKGYHFSNSLTIWVLKTSVAGREDYVIADELLHSACARWNPIIAEIGQNLEFQAKNRNPQGNWIGQEFNLALPGVYWGTYFGPTYLDLIGREKILSAPAARVERLGTGAVVYLSDSPYHWKTARYRRAEKRVRGYLGCEYFFDRKHANRRTVAPDFNVPPVPPRHKGRVFPKVGPVPKVLQGTNMVGVLSIVLGIIAAGAAFVLPMLLATIVAFAAFSVAMLGLLRSLIIRETYAGPAEIGLVISGAVLLTLYISW